jgi:hypothetical protein
MIRLNKMYKNVAGKNSAVRFVRMEGRKFEASIYLDHDQTIPKEYWDRHESLVSSVIIRKANTFMQTNNFNSPFGLLESITNLGHVPYLTQTCRRQVVLSNSLHPVR